MELKSGKLLKNGEYRIERVLGQGGFGITYLAYQIGLDRKVAIKEFFMSDFCNRDADTSHVSVPSVGSRETVEKFKIKFIKEAKNIAALNNPHIIRIHDIFEDNGTAYYVMEYHDGGSLQGLIDRRGRLSEQEALVYIRQIADALQYIHKRNMNHLDVKPGNVLLDDEGNAVLIDFGLSKRYDAEGNQTSTTPVGISHGYAPFEQYQHGGVSTFSPATDIYSLGATFYKLITGNTPPNATVVGEDGLPPYPSPVSLSTSSAIEKSMQLLRKNRPQSISEFLALLASPSSASTETLIAEEAGESTVFPENEKSEKQAVEVKVSQLEDGKKKRSSWIFVLLAVLLIAGIGVGLYVLFSGKGNTKNESVSDTGSVAVMKIDSLANKDSADTVSANTNVVVNTIIYEDTDEKVSADTHVESNTNANANENVKQEDSDKESDKAENSKDNLTAEELYWEGVKYYNAKDYAKAVEFYRKAAGQGHVKAQYNLGTCFYNGDGVPQNYVKAVEWFRKAAEQGHVKAQYYLGNCYDNGRGASQDYTEAVKWYRKAAEQGDDFAQYNLGTFYELGQGVSQNYTEAVKWYRKAAEQGLAGAQNNLGVCYGNGRGVPQDYTKAVEWYRKAAEQGLAEAQFSLGWCYHNNWGVPQNYTKAVEWYRKAAEQGLAEAQFNLGTIYANGEGVAPDPLEAAKWYRKAAEQGDANALYNLGLFYAKGYGVPQNYSEAFKLTRKAALKDHAPSQYNLGVFYDNGFGVDEDDSKAVEWYRKAADKGNEDAKKRLKELKDTF